MREDKYDEINEETESEEPKKNFFDNILEKIGVERYADDEEDEADEENTPHNEQKQEEPKTATTVKTSDKQQTSSAAQTKKSNDTNKSTNNAGGNMNNNYEATSAHMKVFTPIAVGEVRDVCDQLRKGYAVVVNTDKLNDADYCRFYDFVYGAAYMIDGKVSQISDTVLILTPSSIDITNAVREDTPADEDIFTDDNIDTDDIDDLVL